MWEKDDEGSSLTFETRVLFEQPFDWQLMRQS